MLLFFFLWLLFNSQHIIRFLLFVPHFLMPLVFILVLVMSCVMFIHNIVCNGVACAIYILFIFIYYIFVYISSKKKKIRLLVAEIFLFYSSVLFAVCYLGHLLKLMSTHF